MVFSATYCRLTSILGWKGTFVFLQGPYCTKAKKILGKYKLDSYKVVEIDKIPDGDDYIEILGRMTGADTVPRVFIGGECIGGGDDTERLEKQGQLEKKLKAVGALNDWLVSDHSTYSKIWMNSYDENVWRVTSVSLYFSILFNKETRSSSIPCFKNDLKQFVSFEDHSVKLRSRWPLPVMKMKRTWKNYSESLRMWNLPCLPQSM